MKTLPVREKTCLRCRCPLPASRFAENGKSKDGLTSSCLACLDRINRNRGMATRGAATRRGLSGTAFARGHVTCARHSRKGCVAPECQRGEGA